MNTLIVAVVLVVGSVQGAEWMTSGSNHCIERCRPGTRKDLDAVLWCPVVDGVTTEHRPASTESGRPSVHEEDSLAEEDKYKWDYCYCDTGSSGGCSPSVPLKRVQLTSHNKLWCISDCLRGSGNDYYECKYVRKEARCKEF